MTYYDFLVGVSILYCVYFASKVGILRKKCLETSTNSGLPTKEELALELGLGPEENKKNKHKLNAI